MAFTENSSLIKTYKYHSKYIVNIICQISLNADSMNTNLCVNIYVTTTGERPVELNLEKQCKQQGRMATSLAWTDSG